MSHSAGVHAGQLSRLKTAPHTERRTASAINITTTLISGGFLHTVKIKSNHIHYIKGWSLFLTSSATSFCNLPLCSSCKQKSSSVIIWEVFGKEAFSMLIWRVCILHLKWLWRCMYDWTIAKCLHTRSCFNLCDMMSLWISSSSLLSASVQ